MLLLKCTIQYQLLYLNLLDNCPKDLVELYIWHGGVEIPGMNMRKLIN